MTPEQMKINPIKPSIKVKTKEELDTEEGESNEYEEEFTTSEELTEDEYLHFQTSQNKILNLTLMLMRLNIKNIHKHLNSKFIIHTTQQSMMKMM